MNSQPGLHDQLILCKNYGDRSSGESPWLAVLRAYCNTVFPEELMFITSQRVDSQLCFWNWYGVGPTHLPLADFNVSFHYNTWLTVSVTAFSSTVRPSSELSKLTVVLGTPKLATDVRIEGGLRNLDLLIWYLSEGGLVDYFLNSKYNTFYPPQNSIFSCLRLVLHLLYMFCAIFTNFIAKCFNFFWSIASAKIDFCYIF